MVNELDVMENEMEEEEEEDADCNYNDLMRQQLA